jgi:hypothetical protein
MMKIKHSFYETHSPLFERHEDMAIYYFLSFCFFFTMLLSMYFFSSFFSSFLYWRGRSLNMEFILLMDGKE